jgi:rubrerythrin
MIIHTASEGISLARELENASAGFYEEMARRYPAGAETFLSFAKENKKNIAQFERAYYGVITDAIEGCFAFDMETDAYKFEAVVPQDASYSEVLNRAVSMENKIIQFYSDAAMQSKSLMADVPRAFAIIARKRAGREPKLRSLDGG